MTEDTSARRPLFKVFSFASYYSDPSDASPCGETAGGTKTTVVFRLDDPLFTFRTEREKERCAPYDFGAHDGAPRFCTVSTGGAHSRNTYPCTRNRPCMEPTGNETSEKKEQTKRGTRDKRQEKQADNAPLLALFCSRDGVWNCSVHLGRGAVCSDILFIAFPVRCHRVSDAAGHIVCRIHLFHILFHICFHFSNISVVAADRL